MSFFDINKPFAWALVATQPSPQTSGLSLGVTAGQGANFPSAPFFAPVCPAGVLPTRANAEIVLVSAIATDTFTIVRAQENTSAIAIAVGYQIFCGITMGNLLPGFDNSVCDGRLTLTTVTPVTTADVTAATTLFFTPYKGNRIALYNGTSWLWETFSELSIAVPATTSQMYDVFVFDTAGTPALELLAWTNDTTRATALVKQDGVLVKSGATTRRYVGSFRTTTVSGQTEDSLAKRHVWNYYNRVRRQLRVRDTTDSWPYTVLTYRQANGNPANQIDVVVGVAEVGLEVFVHAQASSSGTGVNAIVAIGEDSTTTMVTGCLTSFQGSALAAQQLGPSASFRNYPAIGRHFYAWLELSTASGTTTWLGDNGNAIEQSGIHGSIDG